jgi:MtN3 and saliva related transmembrane protein
MVDIANESVMENLVAWTNIIGTIAGMLVLLSFIPQIMKAYKTKKMLDLSPHLMILIASGMFLWVIYGFIRSELVIIGTNVAGFALNITLLIMKLRYDKMLKGSALKA